MFRRWVIAAEVCLLSYRSGFSSSHLKLSRESPQIPLDQHPRLITRQVADFPLIPQMDDSASAGTYVHGKVETMVEIYTTMVKYFVFTPLPYCWCSFSKP